MNIVYVIGTLATGGAEGIVRMLSLSLSKNPKLKIRVIVFNSSNSHLNINELKKNSVEVIIFSNKFTYNPLFIFKLRTILKNTDIVHVHLFPAFYFSVIASIGLNVVKVYTEHCTSNRRSGSSLFRKIDKFFYNQYDSIISISNEVTNFLLSSYSNFPDFKISKIVNAVDIKLFESPKIIAREDFGFNDSDFIVTQVSAFRPQKNQLTAIRAFEILPDRYKLVFCGEGLELKKCRKLVNDLNLTSRVLFLGNRSDIPSILQMSNLSLLSTHYEGLPLVLLESFASKRLVIASNVPGVREVVNGRGLLFENNNFINLSEIILNISNSIQDYDKLIDCAFDFAINNSLANFENSHLELYENLTCLK
jgi:glycosyltransferase involved in cell wall biosynthesis